MIYGYARVSTKGQAKDGNSLEAQEKALRESGANEIYVDAFTGTKTDRPEFDKLMNKIQKGDTLIVTKLDRFARSMSQGSELVSDLIERGIKVYILNIGVMDNTPSSKLIKNPDFREGRPKKYSRKQIEHALELLDNNSYKQVEDLTGISKSTLIRAKKKRG